MAIADPDLKQLLNQARVKLPGVSDQGLKAELYDVFTEFFGDSSCWTEQISFMTLAATVDYILVPADGGQIIRLAGVLDQNMIPQPALMPIVPTLTLEWPPNNQQTFIATVCKNIDISEVDEDGVPNAPDWVLPLYHKVILDGLLGKMMGTMNKPYSNATISLYHLRRFMMGISMARTAALRRNTFGSQAWAYPQTFRSRGQRGGVSTGNQMRFGNT